MDINRLVVLNELYKEIIKDASDIKKDYDCVMDIDDNCKEIESRTKKYEELSVTEKLQADCDLKATNIVLQGLPPDVLVVPVVTQRDDPVAYLNKAMAFLSVVAASRVTVQQVQGRQGQSYAGTGYKGNATSSGGNNARGQDKAMLAQAQESGQKLDEEQLEFRADPSIPDGQAAQITIPNNAAF
ncbi:hypothetical protein Tco_1540676 [Tanacetum coccineum]